MKSASSSTQQSTPKCTDSSDSTSSNNTAADGQVNTTISDTPPSTNTTTTTTNTNNNATNKATNPNTLNKNSTSPNVQSKSPAKPVNATTLKFAGEKIVYVNFISSASRPSHTLFHISVLQSPLPNLVKGESPIFEYMNFSTYTIIISGQMHWTAWWVDWVKRSNFQ